jgi:nucleotide-binding universal stress UspA family protein
VRFLVNADDESVQIALMLAGAFQASLTVLESDETRGRGASALAQFEAAGIEAELISRASGWLPALRAVVRSSDYNLVIVGKMWRRGLSGFLFGNVPGGLLSDVETNVLVVRRRREKIRRILVAVGTGPGGKQVLRWTGLMVKALDAQPTLLHITERPPGMFTGLPSLDESLTQFMRAQTGEAHAFQHAAQTLRFLGIEPQLKLARGLVVEELLAEARAGSYDLIILGSSYNVAASTRLLLEGVTNRLVQRSPCPVLVVRGEMADELVQQQINPA